MHPDRRRLVAAASALCLTVGSGLFVGGALVENGTLLTIVGSLMLVGATVVFMLALGSGKHAVAEETPLVPPSRPTPFEVALFERLSDPVLLVDRKGVVLRASASTARTLGLVPASLSGRPLAKLLHEDDAAALELFLGDIADGKEQGASPRWRVRRADGGWQSFMATATSLLDEPAIGGVAIVLRDDIDCDSYTQTEQPAKNECDPAQYQSASPRVRDSLSCLTWDGTPGSMCVAGGPMCKDGSGDVDCAASTW